jgi:LysM repeat protein
MRSKIWRLLGIVLALLVVTVSGLRYPVFAQSGTVVRVVPTSSSVHVGDIVLVEVQVQNVNDLFGPELHISFDPNVLEVLDANAGQAGVQIGHGDFLSPDVEAVNDVSGGTIHYAISQLPPNQGVNGSGTLARITFKGKAEGTSSVTLQNVILADSAANAIEHTTQNGSVTVYSGDATPVPTATPEPGATATPEPGTPVPTPTPQPGTPVPTPTPAPTPGPGPICDRILGHHVVRQGETLYAIGRAYAMRPTSIATCNNLLNPNRIYAGLRLAIPYDPWWPIPPGPVAERQFTPGVGPGPTPTPAPGCRYTHAVQPGETLTRISLRYGVSIWTIARANDIQNVNLIYVGQKLCIP